MICGEQTGPGRDPHPAGAPQRRLRKRLPRTLSAAALVRTGDDLVLNNNTTTSIMRCQEPTKTKSVPHSFGCENNIHASSHPFPHGRSASSHISPQRCVKRSPQMPHLTGWQETCSQRVFVLSQQTVDDWRIIRRPPTHRAYTHPQHSARGNVLRDCSFNRAASLGRDRVMIACPGWTGDDDGETCVNSIV